MVEDNIKRIGLIGAGAIAQVAHLPSYRKVHGVEVLALCDTDDSKCKAIADRFNIPYTFTDYQDLLKLEELDAVDVCTPNDLHGPISIAAFDAGKHVLCEKPLALGLEEATKITEEAVRKNCKLVIALNHRFRADSMLLKDFVNGGEMGDVYYIKAGWLRRRTDWSRQNWKDVRQRAGGGAFVDLGIHMLDLSLWLLGYPEPERITASTYTLAKNKEVEDSAAAFIQVKTGASIMVEVTWSLLTEQDFHYLNLFGTDGAGLLNPIRIHKEMHGNLVNVTPTLPKADENIFTDSCRREIEFFCQVLQQKADPSPHSEQLILMKVLDAFYQSAREGREVVLSG